jgi:hypothetical protein
MGHVAFVTAVVDVKRSYVNSTVVGVVMLCTTAVSKTVAGAVSVVLDVTADPPVSVHEL